jgi:site-specific DNA-cytosine methylase
MRPPIALIALFPWGGGLVVALRPFRILSLFSGAAGLDRGIAAAVRDASSVCFVERESYAAGVLATRMEAGDLAPAPIWSDVRTFEGGPWRGRVDCVAGGFPCQDISNAGKREGIEGERSGLWSEFARIIREVGPRFVFVENVGALVVRGLDRVLGDLASLGFDAEWGCFRADEVGAPHRRERLFILAYAGGDALRELAERQQQRPAERGNAVPGEHGSDDLAHADHRGRGERADEDQFQREQGRRGLSPAGDGDRDESADMGDAHSEGRVGEGGAGRLRRPALPGAGDEVADADDSGQPRPRADLAGSGDQDAPHGSLAGGCSDDSVAHPDPGRRGACELDVRQGEPDPDRSGEDMADPHGIGRIEGRPEPVDQRRGSSRPGIGSHRFPPGPDRISAWPGPEPAIRRGTHGVACGLDGGVPCLHWRVDRLRLGGNGVVPQQAAYAFQSLAERAMTNLGAS